MLNLCRPVNMPLFESWREKTPHTDFANSVEKGLTHRVFDSD
jgi:hypothetical protein